MPQKNGKRCVLCGTMETHSFSMRDRTGRENRLHACRRCGIVRSLLNTQNSLSEDPGDFGRYYGEGESKFAPVIQKLRDHIMKARAQKYLSMLPSGFRGKGPRILDLGCAEGRLLKAFLEKGCECWGIEHPAYPEERFLQPERITYLKGNIDELHLPEEGFDLIFLWHVLEHLDEPDRTMRRLHEILRPEGLIILAVPNFASLESRCFKGNWFHLDLPWHRSHFTEKSLTYLIEKNQLKVGEMTSLCLEQGPYGFIQSLLNAAGWPKNELYEALKGNWTAKRMIPLMVQFGSASFLAIPGCLVSFITSFKQEGSVLKVILKKRYGMQAPK